ncbi:multiple cyclophane-containing RiPP AmcA [Streptosporangium sandarakinum]
MTMLEYLTDADTPMVDDLIGTLKDLAPIEAAKFDNKPGWDNKTGKGGFDNRPTWDNKSGKK